MDEAGVELLAHVSDAFGLVEAVSALPRIKTAFRRAKDALSAARPDVLVLIDYPDFNLKIASFAKRLGVRILYYVSPQVWAWRHGRITKIASLVDRMAVILPFEERLYREAGVPCEFVGHPVLEEIETLLGTDAGFGTREIWCEEPNVARGGAGDGSLCASLSERRRRYRSLLGFDAERPLLAILPGSRPSELKRHLPLVGEIVRHFKRDPEIPAAYEYQFCVPLAPNTDEEPYRTRLDRLRAEGVVIMRGESVRVLAAAESAVVASGTATLQAAFLRVPMVVIYKLAPLTYALGKRIVKVEHISLVNILSGREVVRELLQQNANPSATLGELKKILLDGAFRQTMVDAFDDLIKQFAGRRASKRVAEIVMEMAEGKERAEASS